MERRDFINNVGQVTAVICTGGLWAACSKSDDGNPTDPGGGGNARLTANLLTELQAVGSSKTNGTTIVIRTGEGNTAAAFVALSLVCTHQQCTIGYNASSNNFACPCHGSQFSISGAVLQGPAASPLTKYSVAVSNNTLTVS